MNDDLMGETEGIITGQGGRDEKLKAVCDLLRERVDHYHWVGFYLVDPNADRELMLGPYSGSDTEHTRIPFGSGICGQAAEREETFTVQDVSKEDNYLSCSIRVKAEIVVPVMKEGMVVGELDIDSHQLSPFTDKDREFLEGVCERVATLL